MCVYTHTYMFKHQDEDFQEKKMVILWSPLNWNPDYVSVSRESELDLGSQLDKAGWNFYYLNCVKEKTKTKSLCCCCWNNIEFFS